MKDFFKSKKKIVMIIVFFILVVAIVIGGALIYNKFFYRSSYSELENVIVEAAKKHMSKNATHLPQNIKDTVTISADDLVRLEEMKPLDSYVNGDVTCRGEVVITNLGSSYRYAPFLDCGDSYRTVRFIDYIKTNHPIVESGNGLYQLNNELVFRGDRLNNFLKLSGKLYRIVKFSNDEAVIILYGKLENQYLFDNRYNVDKKEKVGINDYSVSRVNDVLTSIYYNDAFFGIDASTKVSTRSLLVPYSLEVGKRAERDTDKSGSLEKSTIIENKMIGLLPVYDFLNASLDANCVTTVSPSCMNYNYLSVYSTTWLSATACNYNSYYIFQFLSSPYLTYTNYPGDVRFVLHLNKDVVYVQGDGSYENPYIVK